MGRVKVERTGDQQQPSAAARLLRRIRFRVYALLMSGESRVVRLIRRPLWNSFYSMINRRVPDEDLSFMNLGYLSPGEDDDDAADMGELVSIRLYERVVGDVDLEGRSVVEVGCGHGGGSAHLAKIYRPGSLLGVDINADIIVWCEKNQLAANLKFLQGDALSLPIADDTIDVVVNVESSHCYPSRSRFFDEVVRILRPGGSFVFADIFFLGKKSETPDDVSTLLGAAGLKIQNYCDITPNVLAARDAVARSPAFQARMQEGPSWMVPVMEAMLCLPGSASHNWLASRQIQYWQWRAVKPELHEV
jgi:SAM-dependent methyltransferase